MSAQASLFDERQSEPKRVRETSREALRDILPAIKGRQHEVLDALALYLVTHSHEPTSSELMCFLDVTDPNRVRPRLTELLELRYVEASGQTRRCSVTNRNVHTWALTERGRLYLREQK